MPGGSGRPSALDDPRSAGVLFVVFTGRSGAAMAVWMRRCYSFNMETPPNHNMTVDEFLPWAEAQERGRYELHDGEAIAMAPERAAHWEAKGAAWVALHEAVKAAALKCHVVPNGATVRISARTAFDPDALVYCGEEVAGDSLEVPNPVIVVEVLSPGTQMIDMRDKLRGYFTVPSVQHYLIVDPEKQVVIHHARGDGDALQTRLLSTGELRLDPPGIVLNVQEFFG
jgi:Uma2 family endonuclease